MFTYRLRVLATPLSGSIVALALGCAGQAANQPAHQEPVAAELPATAETHTPGVKPASGSGVVQRPVLVSSLGAFAEWDGNGDGQVELKEFRDRISQHGGFGQNDTDRDNQLNEPEFSTALYHAWDTNGDGLIDVYEYRNGQGGWFVDGRWHAAFEDWDRDGNKELTLVELRAQTPTLLAHWDSNRNGFLDELEYTTGRYNAWDVNNDDIVDVYEFGRLSQQSSTAPAPSVRSYGPFYNYDNDSDAKVTLEEFRQTLARTSMFTDWESIKQATPQDDDFRRRLFQYWDLDGDEKLDMFEFKHGAGVFFPRVDTYGNFVAWDANRDYVLTQEEFVNYEGAAGFAKVWDKNESRRLERDELSGMVYEAWDTNADGVLERAEWRWW